MYYEVFFTTDRSIQFFNQNSFCFRYTIRLFIKGYKKDLDVEDLYNPLKQDRSKLLVARLQRQWAKEMKKAENRIYDPSLFKALTRAFWPEGILLGVFVFITDFCIRLIQPTMLRGMLQYFQIDTLTTKEEALFYAGGMVACNFIIMMFLNHYMIGCLHFGMKLRVATCGIVYEKVKFFKTNLLFCTKLKPRK